MLNRVFKLMSDGIAQNCNISEKKKQQQAEPDIESH